MSNFENDEAIRPLSIETDAYVESIYPIPGTQLPDLESQLLMEEYLESRFVPEESVRNRVVLVETGRTMPGISRETVGTEYVSRYRKVPGEWLVSPKKALAVVIGSFALFNLIGNLDTVEKSAAYAGESVYRTFVPWPSKTQIKRETKFIPGRQHEINVVAAEQDKVGSYSVSPNIIGLFVDKIHQDKAKGQTLSSLTITGNTSDEWGSDSSIGVANPQNAHLGLERAAAADKELGQELTGIPKKDIHIAEQEHVINPNEKATLENMAKESGFNNLYDAVQAADSGQKLNPALSAKLKEYFTGVKNRGVAFKAVMNYPGHRIAVVKSIKKKIVEKGHLPKIPEPNFWGFIPMLPIRRRERYTKLKDIKKWKFSSSQPIYKPRIIHEDIETAWLRIRPEAVKEDGSLLDSPWAYTRKYENLVKDGRIADVLRADYQDDEGADRSIRIMFVDEKPEDATVKAFSGLLDNFAQMENGSIGRRISGIFVYPSENAGTDHNNPKRIALGIDKQSPKNIQGTYTYALDLVEMHMPATVDSEEIARILEEFNGPAWVLAHETSGHGTDDNDAPLKLVKVKARNIPNAHIIDGNPRARKMSGIHSRLKDLIGEDEPITFEIEYPVIDNHGQIVTTKAVVKEGDPRLDHATKSRIKGFKHTRYANTNETEDYAEVAASIATNIPVPYDEAGVSVKSLKTDGGQRAAFATGYYPDRDAVRVFKESVGADTNRDTLSFTNHRPVIISRVMPEDDPLIRRELARASRLRTLRPEQMTAILARVLRREK